jgi:hypothetical protein
MPPGRRGRGGFGSMVLPGRNRAVMGLVWNLSSPVSGSSSAASGDTG